MALDGNSPFPPGTDGTEQCGRAVFASKDDPDYQCILKAFETLLKMRLRADMPGFVLERDVSTVPDDCTPELVARP